MPLCIKLWKSVCHSVCVLYVRFRIFLDEYLHDATVQHAIKGTVQSTKTDTKTDTKKDTKTELLSGLLSGLVSGLVSGIVFCCISGCFWMFRWQGWPGYRDAIAMLSLIGKWCKCDAPLALPRIYWQFRNMTWTTDWRATHIQNNQQTQNESLRAYFQT